MNVQVAPVNVPMRYETVICYPNQTRSISSCPDVKLIELPFYDTHSVLMKPTMLLPARSTSRPGKYAFSHTFRFSIDQVIEICNSRDYVDGKGLRFISQVQIRFCALDVSQEQDDLFPPELEIKVNGKSIQLPSTIPASRPSEKPKRPSRPVNITNRMKLSPFANNEIDINWTPDRNRYVISINVVRKLTADDLLLRLKNKEVEPVHRTLERITGVILSEGENLGITPSFIQTSVACPIGKNRMKLPCRSTKCKHIQCFDVYQFILMNEQKPNFICPVCNMRLKFDDLCIDEYFMNVISFLDGSNEEGNDIIVFPDGHWERGKIKDDENQIKRGPPLKKAKCSGEGDYEQSGQASTEITYPNSDDLVLIESSEEDFDDPKPATTKCATVNLNMPAMPSLKNQKPVERTRKAEPEIWKTCKKFRNIMPRK